MQYPFFFNRIELVGPSVLHTPLHWDTSNPYPFPLCLFHERNQRILYEVGLIAEAFEAAGFGKVFFAFVEFAIDTCDDTKTLRDKEVSDS